jgi:hypothetical protein
MLRAGSNRAIVKRWLMEHGVKSVRETRSGDMLVVDTDVRTAARLTVSGRAL